MNVCPRRPTVDSKDRKKSLTLPQESGAAVPFMESHNSKVNISPSVRRAAEHEEQVKVELFLWSVRSALIQLMAAAKAKRGLAFFTFSDKELEQGLEQTYSLLRTKGTTVGEWESTVLHLLGKRHLKKLMSEIADSQRNCLTSWRTTAPSSTHLAPSTWNCLTTSEPTCLRRKNEVCCEPRSRGSRLHSLQMFFYFCYLTLVARTHADFLTNFVAGFLWVRGRSQILLCTFPCWQFLKKNIFLYNTFLTVLICFHCITPICLLFPLTHYFS